MITRSSMRIWARYLRRDWRGYPVMRTWMVKSLGMTMRLSTRIWVLDRACRWRLRRCRCRSLWAREFCLRDRCWAWVAGGEDGFRFDSPSKGVAHAHQFPSRIYACRIARGDRDHRDPDERSAAIAGEGPRGGEADEVFECHARVRPRDHDVLERQ